MDICDKNFEMDENKHFTYFHRPTQVIFFDELDNDEELFLGGVAYQDYIICGECGATISLDEVYDLAESYAIESNAVNPVSWVNLSDTIIGE